MRRMRSVHVLEFVRHRDGVWDLPLPLVEALGRRFPSARFSSPRDQAEADRLLPEVEVVLGWALNRDNFAAATKLEWVHVTAAGVGSVLFPEMVESPVVLTNSRGMHATSMAEHTLAVILAFARKLHLARDAQLERRWTQESLWRDAPEIRDLAGSTLGLVGLGAVGSAIAVRARALGLRVLAVRRHPAADPAPADEQWGPDGLSRLLAAADWVVLATALTAETRRLIGANELERMRPGAVLVNLGRGSLVDETALVAALARGRIAGAALDVFEEEPLPAESPLWSMPHVIVTPHVSGVGPRYWERALELFADNLERFLGGRPLMNVVDKRAGY